MQIDESGDESTRSPDGATISRPTEVLPAVTPGNLEDYEKGCCESNWTSVYKEFGWSNGGSYNVAVECLDRHAHNWRKNKIALFSVTANGETMKYTFREMSQLTSRFADGLMRLGAVKGDRILVYLDRTSELYMAVLGIVKMGVSWDPCSRPWGRKRSRTEPWTAAPSTSSPHRISTRGWSPSAMS